jgi:hypothetical protein
METTTNDILATPLNPAAFQAAIVFFIQTPTLSGSKQYSEAMYLITWPRDGEVLIEGAHGDRYLFTRKDGVLSLGYPENDYSGDPQIVDTFTKLMARHS